MSLFEIIGAVLIGPLKLFFEVVFSVAYSVIQRPGPAIIILSLIVNVLLLPLYRRADAIQIEARDTEKKLKDVVTHIKKTFSGDERMMILQTYYRQNNYNPLSVLSGSVSLLLEIPFFMAAYQFLSGVSVFAGASFGPITDLSVPDGLLVIGGLHINLLPILMTVVNIVSSSLYLKGFPLKTKIQLYGMAAVFLVILYNSPAALVFYWTLNNAFSLVKTLFYRIKNPKKVLTILLAVCGVGFVGLGIRLDGLWRSCFFVALGIAAQLPWMYPLVKSKCRLLQRPRAQADVHTASFVLGGLFLSVLIGLVIPATYVAASPQEYIDVALFYNPIWYVVYTLCLSIGTFLVWLGVFYWLATPRGKVIFTRLVWVLCGVMLTNYMFFGTRLGVVSPNLQYTDGFVFAVSEHVINLAVVAALVVALVWIAKRFPKVLSSVLLIGVIALGGMGAVKSATILKVSAQTKQQISGVGADLPSFTLSKNGQNVVVIMLDRAIGPFVPYILEENPTLKQQFDGFTYYSNTVSYGGFTNLATPSLYGGYDYTPEALNTRDTQSLADKHNEALKVVPTVFADAGYDVTVIDPSYAGYQWIPDISIYNDMEGVTAHIAEGKFTDTDTLMQTVSARKRNFFLFSLMKTMPVSTQSVIYNNGAYRAIPSETTSVSAAFLRAYSVLENMQTMTRVSDGNENTYMFLRSNATHEPAVLQEPTFTPQDNVDNSAYYPASGKTITAGSSSYLLSSYYQISHYHINMSSLIQLGNWFDYLREAGVYDNTRIIVVSDHGRDLGVFDSSKPSMQDIEMYLPLLLVKDFDAEGFTQSEAFMTNADVAALSLDGLVDNPTNPFTGNAITTDTKNQGAVYITLSNDWDIGKNNGNQFSAAEWATVDPADVTDKSNWTFFSEKAVLPPAKE